MKGAVMPKGDPAGYLPSVKAKRKGSKRAKMLAKKIYK